MTAKSAARALLVAGAVAIGYFLLRAAPRDLTLVYGLEAPATALEVTVLSRGEPVRRAEIAVPAGARQVRHAMRLPDGEYLLRVRVDGAGGARRVERRLTVSESATVVLPGF